jgi:hypothetical protein
MKLFPFYCPQRNPFSMNSAEFRKSDSILETQSEKQCFWASSIRPYTNRGAYETANRALA